MREWGLCCPFAGHGIPHALDRLLRRWATDVVDIQPLSRSTLEAPKLGLARRFPTAPSYSHMKQPDVAIVMASVDIC